MGRPLPSQPIRPVTVDGIRRTKPDPATKRDDLACRPPTNPPLRAHTRPPPQGRPSPHLDDRRRPGRRGNGRRRSCRDLRARRPPASGGRPRCAHARTARAGRRRRDDSARASSGARIRRSSQPRTVRARSGCRSALPSRSWGTHPRRSAPWPTPAYRRRMRPKASPRPSPTPRRAGGPRPTAEGIPIDRLSALNDATARADELTGRAFATLESAPTGFVLGPVTSARADAQAELANLHRQLHAGSLVLDRLPSFLGAEVPDTTCSAPRIRPSCGVPAGSSRIRDPHGRSRPVELLRFPPDPIAPSVRVSDVPSPRRSTRTTTTSIVRDWACGSTRT